MNTRKQLSDEIFEKLRGNRSFKVNHCPSGRRHVTKKKPWQRNEMPEGGCKCEDVVYTRDFAMQHTFDLATIVIADPYTKCSKWELEYGSWFYSPEQINDPRWSYRQVDRNVVARDLREKLKQASGREAEMLAWASPELQKTYNKGYVNIRGVPFSISRLRKALMYQDTQQFDITLVTWSDETPIYNRDGCPMLHLMGGSHYIVVLGQHPEDTAKYVGMTSIGYDGPK